jgi:TRAP transporter TAXI family solute receptor
MRSRGVRIAGLVAILGAVAVSYAATLNAQSNLFFRIGTGSTAGTYFPIGGILASAISRPPGSRVCKVEKDCGVDGLIAVVQSSEGSVANVQAIAEGRIESGLSQADVAFWAYSGIETFAETGSLQDLRAIAHLFPESIHLVVRRNAGISKISDIKGLRISLDVKGSGTRADALLILKAFGIGLEEFEAVNLTSAVAADKLRVGELDGFFLVAGAPTNVVTQLAEDSLITLVPINGPKIEGLLEEHPFLKVGRIPAGTYFNVPNTVTLSVGAQWLVSANVSEAVVYEITRALWSKEARELLDRGHYQGQFITLESALDGLIVPLHRGARRFYSETGTQFPWD